MAEELQHLIDRIQREAVDTGEQQAAKIVAQAREKAATIVKEAEAQAAAIVEKANTDAQQYTIRGQQALAQSARDLLITVGSGVEKIFSKLVSDAVDQAMDAATLQAMLVKIVDHYLAAGGSAGSLEVLLSPAEQSNLSDFFKQRFATELAKGLKVTVDPRTAKGFKVHLRDKHIEHDFSREAIADAVAQFLRPALAETVYKIAREQS
jgi:V/A-type H+-transporting ATPase subunit E